MTIISKNIYFQEIQQSMPRILNLLNRNPSSSDYGSFDREYWSYNSSDISNSRKQEAALTLALIYTIKRHDNPYYNNSLILEWINAVLIYTKNLQNKDGSFNEVYPNEHSFVATAFVSYSISETALLLKGKVKKRASVIKYLKRAGDWLIARDEEMALNQKAGSIIALHNIYLLTKNTRYKKGANVKLKEILKSQSKEGWFPEYDGADIGYLSLCIDYLAKYYKKTKDRRLYPHLRKAVDFIIYFMAPDYTTGGEVGSRNTEYVIPHGFELLSGKTQNAKTISNFIRNAINYRKTLSPKTIDDRYLLFNSYTYLQAYIDGTDYEKYRNWPPNRQFLKYFEEAGIAIRKGNNNYSIINTNKGCVSKIIFDKNKSLNDGGAVAILSNGEKLSSNYLGKNDKIRIGKNKIEIKRRLLKVRSTSLNPYSFLAFRIFQLTFGKVGFISRNVRNVIRKKIIRQKNKMADIEFSRILEFKDNKVSIRDEIQPIEDINSIIISSKLSFVFTESSRFFQISDLESKPFLINKKTLSGFYSRNRVHFYREYNNKGNLVKSRLD